MKKHEFGTMPCRECGQTVKVMRNENGSLNYKCMALGCDDGDYATESTTPLKHAAWMKRIKRIAQPEQEQAKEPVKTTKTETAPKEGAGFFG